MIWYGWSVRVWQLSAAICLLAGVVSGEEIRKLERFGDSGVGEGTILFTPESHGNWKLTVILNGLFPSAKYRLSLNALPQTVENEILANLRFPDNLQWPSGQFYENRTTGEKEGYWDFAEIKADENGYFRQEYFLPLPPKKDAYSIKFLVKESFGSGNVVLQCPWLNFVVRKKFIGGSLVGLLTGVLVITAIIVAIITIRRRRSGCAANESFIPVNALPSGARESPAPVPVQTRPKISQMSSEPANVFRFQKDADVWEISFNGDGPKMIDGSAPGLGYIHKLICAYVENGRKPMRVSALVLVGKDTSQVSQVESTYGDQLTTNGGRHESKGHEKDVKLCKEEIDKITEKLETARGNGNVSEVAELQDDIDDLKRVLTEISGKEPNTVADLNKDAARLVQNKIKRACKKIDKSCLALAEHLEKSIQTGYTCCYNPSSQIDWKLD